MTVAEIVKGLLHADCQDGTTHPWTSHDYEKAWLVIGWIEERARNKRHQRSNEDCGRPAHNFPKDQPTLDRTVNETQLALRDFDILPSDYAELERRVREWEKR